MCDCTQGCQKPKQLIGKPEECSPEQVRTCHGEVKTHPYAAVPKLRRNGGGDS